MRGLTLAAVVLSGLVFAGQADSAILYQGHTFYEFNGHYYAMTEGPGVSWNETEGKAAALGGHLVAITSEAENDFIADTFLSDDPITIAWIGLSDEVEEGTFVWTTGEPFAYVNWAPTEPNNGLGQYEEDYVCINWYHIYATDPKGTWSDLSYLGNLAGIVELDHNPIPEPSTFIIWSLLGALAITVGRWRRKRAV